MDIATGTVQHACAGSGTEKSERKIVLLRDSFEGFVSRIADTAGAVAQAPWARVFSVWTAVHSCCTAAQFVFGRGDRVKKMPGRNRNGMNQGVAAPEKKISKQTEPDKGEGN